MSYLLDTCIISEVRQARCDAHVAAWMSGTRPQDAFLSVITLGEIRRGIELHRLKDAKTAGLLDRWLVGLEAHYGDRLLPITATIADRWARLCLNQPLPVSEGLIAATAVEHRLTLVTRNVSDFERSGVSILNPFS